ncbi:Lipoprotein [Legionella beliardensis]|uniref:Lipoprotein n=1 Tax=Legionella beliardensis TaxID=91822 RepID=A0A378I4X7_9GAMM|nr:penicillin-binding protein activator [Legionella beliardensis]STX30239.1 Lipoprotein [Legionella beliardensis]
MLPKFLVLKLSCIIISVVFFSRCTTISESTARTTLSKSTPYTMSAAAYLARAENQEGSEKQNMLIMAAGRSFFDGNWQQTAAILAQTAKLSATQAYIKKIFLAKIDLIHQQPKEAIAKLSSVKHPSELPMFYQAQFHETLAKSYEALDKIVYAANERIKLEHLLTDFASRQQNRKLIWLVLNKLPVAELNTLTIEAKEGTELQGWLKLALIARQTAKDNTSLSHELNGWQQDYPTHPANTILASQMAASYKLTTRMTAYTAPQQMALLLPVTGPLAGPGGAIRDGFMAAYNNSKLDNEVGLRVYDTAAEDVTELYQKALADGADYVVGPLTKTDVLKVAALEHPVPTLLLNDINESGLTIKNNRNNIYHFSLSPLDEAKQVAVKASKNSLTKALIIAPAGAWGSEIASAFISQWEANGGSLIEQLVYDNTTDLNQAVRKFLHVSEQAAKEKQFKVKPGEEGLVISKRRQDFDMIFLLAYPSKARQIMPLLKYYFAGDIPVYATSSVYAGTKNQKMDKDLDGLIFCDMPWVFQHHLTNKNWPEQFNSYSRLYALGTDAYALSAQLNQLVSSPQKPINNNSGLLYLNNAQQISRVLSWGKFKHGIAQKISDA